MEKTYEQIKFKEKIINITISSIFFLVSFTIMIVLLKFISSI